MTPSKKTRDLITDLVFFERSYVVPHSGKTSQLGLCWFRIYGRWVFSLEKVKLICQGATPWKTAIFLKGKNEFTTGE